MSKVIALNIAGSANTIMTGLDRIELVAGKGVVGDRYYKETGTFSEILSGLPDKELTLIESEKIDAFNEEFGFSYTYGDFRRNIVTQGISLNDLAGKAITIAGVRLYGVRLCEPCAHLAGLLTSEIMPALVHKTGLRAQIVKSGFIQIGDKLQV